MSNEIKILFVSNDEVNAWMRPIRMKFNDKELQVSLYWYENDGYEVGTPIFVGDWSDDEKTSFNEWIRQYESKEELDELTAFITPNKPLEED